MKFSEYLNEKLVGKQHKLDKNKNGKLDAEDFNKLRKEDTQLDEESDDAHYAKQSKKMQDAINLHLRKGKSYKDAVAAAKVHVKEEVELEEARMSAAAKLQKAFQREQEKSARERKAGEDLMNKIKEQPKKTNEQMTFEAYRNYHDNRTGFAKRHREDDEYHVPDPTTTTHKVGFHVSKDGGEKHHRTVTVSNTRKTAEEAKVAARAHLEKQGYKIHEEVELDEAAKGHTIEAHGIKGMKRTPWRKTFKSHDHLNDWAEKNDADVHGTRDLQKPVKEEVISEGAYEKAEENKKSADSAKKQGDMFAHHMHMADHHDNMAEWHSSKGRHGEADRHAQKAEEHHEKAMNLKESSDVCKVCGQTPCNCTSIEEGLKPEHNMRPGWMLKADPELAKKVKENQKRYKSFKDTVGKQVQQSK